MSSLHEENPQEVQTEQPDNNVRSAARQAVELAKKHGFGAAYPLVVFGAIAMPQTAAYGTNCWGR